MRFSLRTKNLEFYLLGFVLMLLKMMVMQDLKSQMQEIIPEQQV